MGVIFGCARDGSSRIGEKCSWVDREDEFH